jgi:hypothetical protein
MCDLTRKAVRAVRGEAQRQMRRSSHRSPRERTVTVFQAQRGKRLYMSTHCDGSIKKKKKRVEVKGFLQLELHAKHDKILKGKGKMEHKKMDPHKGIYCRHIRNGSTWALHSILHHLKWNQVF